MFRLYTLVTCALFVACHSYADVVKYDVLIDTSGLVGHPAGPFAIDAQLIGGSDSSIQNTVTLSDFVFNGGSALGNPTFYGGGVVGDLSSTIILTAAPTLRLAGLRQNFLPGQSLAFVLATTSNHNGPDVFGQIYEDTFNLFIHDSSGQAIPTLGYNVVGTDVFISLYIDGPVPSIQGFSSDSSIAPTGGGPPIVIGPPMITDQSQTLIPEPLTGATTAGAILILVGAWRIKRAYRKGRPLCSDTGTTAQH